MRFSSTSYIVNPTIWCRSLSRQGGEKSDVRLRGHRRPGGPDDPRRRAVRPADPAGRAAVSRAVGAAGRLRAYRRGSRASGGPRAEGGDRGRGDRRPSRTAGELRGTETGPARARGDRGVPGAASRPAGPGCRERRGRGCVAPGRRAEALVAGLRPRPHPRRRGGTGSSQAGVHPAGRGVLPARVHHRGAPIGVRGGLAHHARPAQLPPQGDHHRRVRGAHRAQHDRRAWPAGAALPARPGHGALPAAAPPTGMMAIRRPAFRHVGNVSSDRSIERSDNPARLSVAGPLLPCWRQAAPGPHLAYPASGAPGLALPDAGLPDLVEPSRRTSRPPLRRRPRPGRPRRSQPLRGRETPAAARDDRERRMSKGNEARRRTAATEPEFVQLLAPDGERVSDGDYSVDFTDEEYRGLYRDLVIVRRLDAEATALQRQGELGIWASLLGQEAAQVGSGRALQPDDFAFPTYRAHGVAGTRGVDPLWLLGLFRGVNLGGWDPTAHNFNLYTIVIGSQTLHATGYAMGIQRDGGGSGGDYPAAVIAYFGDGASSQGDVNEAFVWSSVYNAPVVFFCQNNQWAISEPIEKQTRIPLYQRARGFGFPGIRVDGNDVLACLAVTRAALARAREGSGPTLIEAYTYRMGAHTTSDDPTRYRLASELESWKLKDPIERLKAYLVRGGLAEPEFLAGVDAEAKMEAAHLRERVLEMPDPEPLSLFDHVYPHGSPEVDEERARHASYLASFAGEAH